MKVTIITHCHKNFGGWFRAKNITRSLERLGVSAKLVSNQKHYTNPFTRVKVGLHNCWEIVRDRAEMVHIFELIMPETLLPALFCKLIRRKVVLDIADEWLDSPTYHQSNPLLKSYIHFIQTKLVKLFPYITVPSDYLKQRLELYTKSGIFKVINSVDTNEFEPISRKIARERLGFSPKDRILIAIGNTFGNHRQELINETFKEVQKTNPETTLISGKYLSNDELPLYLGAADLALFPTDGSNAELACVSIRVMTYLNAGLVIATDNSPSEWHETLKPYDCLVQASNPYVLARKINEFLSDKKLRKRMEANVQRARRDLDCYIIVRKLYYGFYKRICRETGI